MFSRKLQEEEGNLFLEYIATPQQLLALTEAELRSFHAINCHICNQPLGGDNVRGHCHIVGFYRCAALSRCNLACRISKSDWKLPVVIHSLKGYDGHLIAKALKSELGEARVIPQNIEKYLSITVGRIKFIDSLQITSQSLDSLVKTLEVDEFKYVREAFPTAHEFELIKRKGVYPYDYMDSFARFDESRLPSQDAFFSKLSGSPCSDTEYAHATQVWTAIECESMADHHDIYDVLLLTDFYGKFRSTCLAHYSLDAVHYYTAPALAWDAALRMTHVSLELITDIDKYHFISMVTTRYAWANAPTLPGNDASRPTRISSIWTRIICMDGQCSNHCPPTGSDSSIQMRLMH